MLSMLIAYATLVGAGQPLGCCALLCLAVHVTCWPSSTLANCMPYRFFTVLPCRIMHMATGLLAPVFNFWQPCLGAGDSTTTRKWIAIPHEGAGESVVPK